MDDQITAIAERYLVMLRQIEEIVIGIKGDLDSVKLISAIQVVHLEQVRRCHEVLQAALPEKERRDFDVYLSDLSKAVSVGLRNESVPPGTPPTPIPPPPTMPVLRKGKKKP